MRGQDGTSGIGWSKATEMGYSLLLSPVFGFVLAAIVLMLLKLVFTIRPSIWRRRATSRRPGGSAASSCLLAPPSRCPRIKRWAEGDGPDHADLDRHGANHLHPQPRPAGFANRTVPDNVGRGRGIVKRKAKAIM